LLEEFEAAIREGFATMNMAISGEPTQAEHKKTSAPIWQKQTSTGNWYTPKPELADHL
jgi:hypothetical protein